MNKQQNAQAKASWGMHLQPHVAPPTKAPPRIVGFDFLMPEDWPREKAAQYYRMEHSLVRHPELRKVSILPPDTMVVLVAHPQHRLLERTH